MDFKFSNDKLKLIVCWLVFVNPMYFDLWSVVSLVPRPHLWVRVWWHPADTLGFINIDYLLERNISPLITLQKRQSTGHPRLQHDDTVLFLVHKLVIGSQYAYSKLWIFNKARGISWMSPDQGLGTRLGSSMVGMKTGHIVEQQEDCKRATWELTEPNPGLHLGENLRRCTPPVDELRVPGG